MGGRLVEEGWRRGGRGGGRAVRNEITSQSLRLRECGHIPMTKPTKRPG